MDSKPNLANVKWVRFGDIITIKLNRRYGPYLDVNQPCLKVGEYQVEILGHDYKREPSAFSYSLKGYKYRIQPEDCTFDPIKVCG